MNVSAAETVADDSQPVRSPVSKPPLTPTAGPASSVIEPNVLPPVMIGASSAPLIFSVSVVGAVRPRLSVTVKLNWSVTRSPTWSGSTLALAS